MTLKAPFCKHIRVNNSNLDFYDKDLMGGGYYGEKVSKEIEGYCKGSKVFLTPSGTSALEMGCVLIDLKPGDEVIMPSYTFTSTANAVLLRGAVPVFVDIKPGSLDIDEILVEKAINKNTKCIIPVFYGGASSNIDKLELIAKSYNLILFPDAAQAIGSYYDGNPIESYGSISALSFHQTKNIGCGEGGALIVNDKSLIKKAEIIQEKGTNRSEFFRGEVDKYSWKEIGSSYLMSELCSSYLLDSIVNLKEITQRRRNNWDYYNNNLVYLEREGLITLPKYSDNCIHNGHIFFIVFKSVKKTEFIRVELNKLGINVVSHYYPLHMTKVAQENCKLGSEMTQTEYIFDKMLRLPLYDHISREQQDSVIKSLQKLI